MSHPSQLARVVAFVLGVGFLPLLVRLAPAAPAAQTSTAVTDARKRVADAQLVVNDFKAEQKRIKDRRTADFGDKDEWANVTANAAKAKKASDAARREALLAARSSEDYKRIVKDRDAHQMKLDQLGQQRDPDPKSIATLGTVIANDGVALKKLETAAVDQDAKVLDAKDALDKAEERMKALDAEVEGSLQSDPQYVSLLQQVDQAEQQLVAAKDSLQQTIKSDAAARKASRPPPAPKPVKKHHSGGGRRSMGGGY